MNTSRYDVYLRVGDESSNDLIDVDDLVTGVGPIDDKKQLETEKRHQHGRGLQGTPAQTNN